MKKVEVVPHNPRWAEEFKAEAEKIAHAFGDNLIAVHHMGSTSISGIFAKPIIDVLVEVKDIKLVDTQGVAMENLGYEVKGEFGIPGRRYFRKDNREGVRTHHIHTFQTDSEEVERHLAFRDYLIAHPEEAQKYSDLKKKLAGEHPLEMERYIEGKEEFIQETDRKAALWRKTRKS